MAPFLKFLNNKKSSHGIRASARRCSITARGVSAWCPSEEPIVSFMGNRFLFTERSFQFLHSVYSAPSGTLFYTIHSKRILISILPPGFLKRISPVLVRRAALLFFIVHDNRILLNPLKNEKNLYPHIPGSIMF
jgi:hypothetical protein